VTFFLRFARTTSVPSLAVGQRVVVEGKVVAESRIKVPGTDFDAVYHETLTEEFKAGVRQGRAFWQVASQDEELEPFWVEDSGGRVYVRPEPGRVLVRGGRSDRGPGKRNGTRYVARWIAAGDVVRVRGTVAQPKPGKKGKVRPGLEILGAEADRLVILFRRPS